MSKRLLVKPLLLLQLTLLLLPLRVTNSRSHPPLSLSVRVLSIVTSVDALAWMIVICNIISAGHLELLTPTAGHKPFHGILPIAAVVLCRPFPDVWQTPTPQPPAAQHLPSPFTPSPTPLFLTHLNCAPLRAVSALHLGVHTAWVPLQLPQALAWLPIPHGGPPTVAVCRRARGDLIALLPAPYLPKHQALFPLGPEMAPWQCLPMVFFTSQSRADHTTLLLLPLSHHQHPLYPPRGQEVAPNSRDLGEHSFPIRRRFRSFPLPRPPQSRSQSVPYNHPLLVVHTVCWLQPRRLPPFRTQQQQFLPVFPWLLRAVLTRGLPPAARNGVWRQRQEHQLLLQLH
jgi:hypothetical protein